MAEIDVTIRAKTDAAAKAISDFATRGKAQLSSMESSLDFLKNVELFKIAAKGLRLVTDQVEAFIASASESEAAVNALNVSLKLSGDFTQGASDAFQEFADQLQRTTTFTDEAILNNVALAKSFNVTNTQARNLVKAATDLAAATGLDLNTATQLLGRSLDGTAGKLNELVPSVKNLTAEQLKSGAAIKLIQDRFNGAAAAAGQTFGGAIIRARNALDQIFETFGTYIIQNVIVRKGLDLLIKSLQAFGDSLKNNDKSLKDFVKNGILGITDAIGITIQFFAVLGRIIGEVVESFRDFYNFLKALPKILTLNARLLGTFDLSALKELKQLNDDLNKNSADRQKQLDDRIQGFDDLTQKVADYRVEVERTESAQLQSNKTASDGISNQIKLVQKLTEEQRKAFLELVKNNPFDAIFKIPKNADLATVFGGLAVGFGTAISKGAEGASQILTTGIKTGINALVPGLGDALGPLIEQLQKGPEAIKKFTQDFVSSLPQFFSNLLQAVPVFIVEFVKGIPVIIRGFLASLPDIINGFVTAIPEIVSAFILGIPEIIQAQVEQAPRIIAAMQAAAPRVIARMVTEIPKVVVEFSKEFLKIPADFAKLLFEKIKELFQNLTKIGGAIGGAAGDAFNFLGGAAGAIGGPIAAIGGVVGNVIGDVFGGLFKTGQLSIDKPQKQAVQVQNVGGGLDTESVINALSKGGQAVTIKLQIGEKELASTILNLNRRGFKLA